MQDVVKIRKEANMLSQLSHNNIVRYFDSWVETANIPLDEYDTFFSESDKVV